MSKNIKVTEEQYRKLQEAIDNDFIYFTDDDVKNCNGLTNISADGKLDDNEFAEPVTSDKIQQSLTPQGYNRYRTYGNISHSMREGVDVNKDNVDDFYNNDEMDIMSNGDEKDNLVKIPAGVDNKTQLLVDAIANNKLTPKQQAIVINKLIETLDLSQIPYSWRKELMLKLKANK